MIELLLAMIVLLVAFLFMPPHWFFGTGVAERGESNPLCPISKQYVPEDAVLRRHFVSHLRREIEASLHPRPVDSILQLDYDALVDARLAQRLVEIGSLQSC